MMSGPHCPGLPLGAWQAWLFLSDIKLETKFNINTAWPDLSQQDRTQWSESDKMRGDTVGVSLQD